MDTDQLVGWVVIGLALVALLTSTSVMFVECVKDVRLMRACRRRLLGRADELRIGRMIGALGMSTRAYVHRTPWTRVAIQLGRCESCPAVSRCDAALRERDLRTAGEFCPNFDELFRLRWRSHPSHPLVPRQAH